MYRKYGTWKIRKTDIKGFINLLKNTHSIYECSIKSNIFNLCKVVLNSFESNIFEFRIQAKGLQVTSI